MMTCSRTSNIHLVFSVCVCVCVLSSSVSPVLVGTHAHPRRWIHAKHTLVRTHACMTGNCQNQSRGFLFVHAAFVFVCAMQGLVGMTSFVQGV
jgi:hypothetical protein